MKVSLATILVNPEACMKKCELHILGGKSLYCLHTVGCLIGQMDTLFQNLKVIQSTKQLYCQNICSS